MDLIETVVVMKDTVSGHFVSDGRAGYSLCAVTNVGRDMVVALKGPFIERLRNRRNREGSHTLSFKFPDDLLKTAMVIGCRF